MVSVCITPDCMPEYTGMPSGKSSAMSFQKCSGRLAEPYLMLVAFVGGETEGSVHFPRPVGSYYRRRGGCRGRCRCPLHGDLAFQSYSLLKFNLCHSSDEVCAVGIVCEIDGGESVLRVVRESQFLLIIHPAFVRPRRSRAPFSRIEKLRFPLSRTERIGLMRVAQKAKIDFARFR
jgi:hypothetical protein